MRLFDDPADYQVFEQVLAEGLQRYPVDLFTFCLMPQPLAPGSPARNGRGAGAVAGLGRRHSRAAAPRPPPPAVEGGHLYQGRFKSFPVQADSHFLAVCRYVEANAVRAKRVRRAELWQWTGLWRRQQRKTDLPLAGWPQDRPRGWPAHVNEAIERKELEAVRTCVNRGRPYGAPDWVAATAARLGLEFTLRNAGRPRKTPSD